MTTGARPVWNHNQDDQNDPWTDCFGFMGTLKARNAASFYRSGIRSLRNFPERIAEIENFDIGPITQQEAITVRQFRLAPAEGPHSITFQHLGHFGGGYVLNAAEFDESQQIASFWNDIEKAFHEMDEVDLDKMDVKKIIKWPDSQGESTSEDVGTFELSPPFL